MFRKWNHRPERDGRTCEARVSAPLSDGLMSTTEEDAIGLMIGKEGAKVAFILLPMVEEEEEKERLKELLNG
ncbi:hypothetical protein CROQUDRAFT_101123 [Cronartium quercuum f. sp. fusiforme G11]|uniref:Uncharacterized protein n=1 Tax=Cronartium quercuum f. sp. fusiforme G11 TaxID=708437 RepID=A0A9P6N5L4_9BASI|nr:hypothetical protein CROQUDRAFT_101123 [Cronartium quercuum f. sp. fusiforme G11]